LQCILEFQSDHAQWRSKWWDAPRTAGLGGASTYFIQAFKNEFFNRNLGQNMPKIAYFFEIKAVKLPQRPGAPPPNSRRIPAAGDSAPNLLRCYFHLLL